MIQLFTRIISLCLVLVAFSPAAPKINSMVIDSTTWIDVATLAANQGVALRWNLLAHRLEMGSASQQVAWTEGYAFAATRDSLYRIETSPKLTKGTWWVPLESTLRIMGNLSGSTYKWSSGTISVKDQRDLVSFKLNSKGKTDVAEIRLSKKVQYETFFHPPHFVIRLSGVHGDSSLFAEVRSGKFVKKVSPIQENEVYQISFMVESSVNGADVAELENGTLLQISFDSPKTEVASSANSLSSSAAKKKLKTIVIDPGHGGKDPGAVGKIAYEKDIALAVGKRLRDKLKRHGFQIKMTRDDDTFIELQDRPATATKAQGDLFISLHCNAVEGEERRKKTDGFRIYILREAESEEDKAIARRENKAAELSAKKSKSEISPVEWILLENQLNLYTKESERFAELVVGTYEGGQIRKMGSGAGQAGFMVLVGAFMPAALVELGFITHPDDEAFMASEKGQEELADRLLKSILKYRDSE